MPASFRCHHPGLVFDICGMQMPGEVEAFVHLSVHCETCNTRFRFVGVDKAHDTSMPGVDRTATKIVLPMVEVA